MEPTFAEVAGDTATPELRRQLDAAVASLPPAYCLNPSEDELADSREAAFVCLQN
jgi:hypothetical protein